MALTSLVSRASAQLSGFVRPSFFLPPGACLTPRWSYGGTVDTRSGISSQGGPGGRGGEELSNATATGDVACLHREQFPPSTLSPSCASCRLHTGLYPFAYVGQPLTMRWPEMVGRPCILASSVRLRGPYSRRSQGKGRGARGFRPSRRDGAAGEKRARTYSYLPRTRIGCGVGSKKGRKASLASPTPLQPGPPFGGVPAVCTHRGVPEPARLHPFLPLVWRAGRYIPAMPVPGNTSSLPSRYRRPSQRLLPAALRPFFVLDSLGNGRVLNFPFDLSLAPSHTVSMVYSLSYRRPRHVDDASLIRSESHASGETNREGSSLRSGQSGASVGVPEALTFDKIISGGTCPVRPPSCVKPAASRGPWD